MGANSSHHKKHNQHHQRVKKNVHWTTENAEPPAPPGKPQLLADSPHTDRDVFTIRWDPPDYDGGSPITGFLVEHRRTGSPYWVRASPHMVQDLELMISGLEPGWRYQFRVTAENDVGFSDPGPLSEPLTVTYQRSPAAAPSFSRALHDATALENEKVEFTVQVEGIPVPKVCWYKDGFEIFSSRRQRIVTDNDISTLIIHQAALMDEGEIKCTATNRAGHSITKARLRLEAPPTIRLPKQYEDGLLFEMGEIIKLKVSIAGMPPPTARWLHNGEPLTSSGRHEITHTDKYLNLRINDARRADRGEYQAHAVNSLGEDVASFLVTVTDRPLPPGKAKVVMTLGKSVTLSWSEPEDDGGCKIGNYIVEYFRIGWNMWLKAATCRQLTTTLGDLIEGSEYKFRVKAENPYGVSDPSEESDVIFIPDPKRGLLEPPARGSTPNENSENSEIFLENWYDERKIRGRSDNQQPSMENQASKQHLKRKEKIWKGGDDSMSSGSSVFLSDNDLNKIRNTSSLEGTPLVPKRKTRLSREFNKSGSLLNEWDDSKEKTMNRENDSMQSLEDIKRERSASGFQNNNDTSRQDRKIAVSKSPSPGPTRMDRRYASMSPTPLDNRYPSPAPKDNRYASMSPPPPRRRKKSKSKSPASEERNKVNNTITKSSNSSLVDDHVKALNKSPSQSPKVLKQNTSPGASIKKADMSPEKKMKLSIPKYYSDIPSSSELDEGEENAITVKNVIQIKIKTDDKELITPQDMTPHDASKQNNTHYGESDVCDSDAIGDVHKLSLQYNLSDQERKKLSLGTQKSFEDKAEKDLNDMLHGSSELMLLLLPNSSRENSEERELRNKEMKINLSIDNIMAPPISLSAPEINDISYYMEDPVEVPIREAFSSTELLHEKKMARLYQSLEEIEMENEQYKLNKTESKTNESKHKLKRRKSLNDKRMMLLEKRRSSEVNEFELSRKLTNKTNNKISEDEFTEMSDYNPSDDNSHSKARLDNIVQNKIADDESDYDIVEKNELNQLRSNHSMENVCPRKDTIIKNDEYYENLGDALTKKYGLNEIEIKIDKPDDDQEHQMKGTYEVDKEMLLKRAKLKPQYSSEMSEASNITDDEQEEDDEEDGYDFDEILYDDYPLEDEQEPTNFARNRLRYMEDEEERTYHPRRMVMFPNEDDLDEPPDVPKHNETPEVPIRTTSMLHNNLSPSDMLKKQPDKPILKNNKNKKIAHVTEVNIHIDNEENSLDNVIIKSPKVSRKKKIDTSEIENKRKVKSIEETLKPILKKENMHVDNDNKINDRFGYPINTGGNILLIPKLFQKVSDIETSDTENETTKTRKKHVRITEPKNNNKEEEENDVIKSAVINHYSDIVKEYSANKPKSQTKMILSYDELKAKAIEAENSQNIDWNKIEDRYDQPAYKVVDEQSYYKNMSYQNEYDESTDPNHNMHEPFVNQTSSNTMNNLFGQSSRTEKDNSSTTQRVTTDVPSNSNDMVVYNKDGTTNIDKQKRIHSVFDYTVDVFVFGIACWIYFFKHPILCVPILILLICKQIYENKESFLFWKQYYKQHEPPPK